ncbi:MAG: hypothetical protein A2283_19930 [Lentisphaerae bacterium RIFOXYA12_FULL_48_11]|nr:MAG: hypothetical protein A2283_19930 [Lentisphaerae bacterium RIFOXYA12_FULL_48_11]
MKRTVQAFLTILTALTLSTTARALPIDNGNDLALNYVSAKTPAAKKQLIDPVLGKLHYFRYLKITEMTESTTNGFRNVFIRATEPSSSMIVEFNVLKNVSLKILDDDPKTKIGDAIGVQGRLETMGKVTTNTIVLNPVIVKHKDKFAPVRGKEFLYELDPNARMGTDTSGGTPKVLKAK